MAEPLRIDALRSAKIRKQLGRPRYYGHRIYGGNHFGNEDIYIAPNKLGAALFGGVEFGDLDILSGVWQEKKIPGGTICKRIAYMQPHNPQSEGQTIQRAKYTAGYTAWKALSDEEKTVLNKRAFGTRMSGYNLYMKECM